MVAILGTKLALQLPLLKVGRRVDVHVLSLGHDHVPAFDVLVPEHMRVAIVGCVACEHGVSCIFCEGLSVVVAVGNALCLVLSGRCVHGYHGPLAEARGVVVVNHSRAAEDRTPGVSLNGVALEGPVEQVGRCRVAPCHVLPL